MLNFTFGFDSYALIITAYLAMYKGFLKKQDFAKQSLAFFLPTPPNPGDDLVSSPKGKKPQLSVSKPLAKVSHPCQERGYQLLGSFLVSSVTL